MQCMSTVPRCSGRRRLKYPVFQVVYMSGMAYLASLIAYQLLKMISLRILRGCRSRSKRTRENISCGMCPRRCASWIVQNIHLRITGMRASSGDYRPPTGNGHQITVNHDLNPFAFLITFTKSRTWSATNAMATGTSRTGGSEPFP